jgi:hypothetical protein
LRLPEARARGLRSTELLAVLARVRFGKCFAGCAFFP